MPASSTSTKLASAQLAHDVPSTQVAHAGAQAVQFWLTPAYMPSGHWATHARVALSSWRGGRHELHAVTDGPVQVAHVPAHGEHTRPRAVAGSRKVPAGQAAAAQVPSGISAVPAAAGQLVQLVGPGPPHVKHDVSQVHPILHGHWPVPSTALP